MLYFRKFGDQGYRTISFQLLDRMDCPKLNFKNDFVGNFQQKSMLFPKKKSTFFDEKFSPKS